MLKRKVQTELINWKNNRNKKCLVVKGARQVGKTYAIRQFGKENFDEVLEINFKETPSAVEIFSGDLDVDTMLTALKFRYPEMKLDPLSTLIFLDEIQECPSAITSLKFWAEDNRFFVIASGSLLGIDYKRAESYPVGYVDFISMYGLDFEEYLWARGITSDMIVDLKRCFDDCKPVPEAVHNSMMKQYRTYVAIGGMPEAVADYISNKDFRSVDRIQRELLQGYLYDIAHYASTDEKIKAEKCYLSLGKQLLDKENHKFQYKEVESGGRAQKYYSSIEWLLRADIISLCKMVTDVCFDLDDYTRDDFFRAYTTDLSLLISMKDYSLKQHIVENTLEGNTKGGIYECAIADALIKKGYNLYFYKNDSNRYELDFLIQKEGKVIPVEVKGGNAKATSLNTFVKNRDNIEVAYKFIDGNVGSSEAGVISVPHYMVMFI